jgi:hypothetical protein
MASNISTACSGLSPLFSPWSTFPHTHSAVSTVKHETTQTTQRDYRYESTPTQHSNDGQSGYTDTKVESSPNTRQGSVSTVDQYATNSLNSPTSTDMSQNASSVPAWGNYGLLSSYTVDYSNVSCPPEEPVPSIVIVKSDSSMDAKSTCPTVESTPSRSPYTMGSSAASPSSSTMRQSRSSHDDDDLPEHSPPQVSFDMQATKKSMSTSRLPYRPFVFNASKQHSGLAQSEMTAADSFYHI